MISMSAIWDETVAYVRTEFALLVPLALATLLVGNVVFELARQTLPPDGSNPAAVMAMILAALWSVTGQLAVVALILRPGSSVGEGLALAGKRLIYVIGIGMLILAGTVLLLAPVVYAVATSGFDPKAPETIALVPTWVSFYILPALAILVWLTVRLALINPLIVDRAPGFVETLQRGFTLTRGIAWRLLAMLLLYALVAFLISTVASFIFGSVFVLIGKAAGSEFLGTALTALLDGAVSSALTLLATVFTTILYIRISTGI